MKGVHFLHAAEHQSFYKLGLLFLMEVARFYGDPAMFIITCFLAQPGCRNFLSEHCNTIIKQQLCGERLSLPPSCFAREAGYIAANHPRPIKQARKSLHQVLIQIISTQVLQQSTTILQLKVYISYVVQKLVGHPPQQECPSNLASSVFPFPICLQCKISGSSVFSIFSP